MKFALVAAAALVVFGFSGCASSSKDNRAPAGSGEPRVRIQNTGESCRLNLDGDKEQDTVEVTMLGGKRVIVIMHPMKDRTPRYFVEELGPQQLVECVVNQEPGVSVQGTDANDKAAKVSLLNDYFRVEKPEAGAKVMYFDKRSGGYRALNQGD